MGRATWALLVALVGAMCSMVAPAAASQWQTATGTYSILTETSTPVTTIDGYAISRGDATLSYGGGLTGSATFTDTSVQSPGLSFWAIGTEVCSSCTLGGRTGGFTAVWSYSGAFTNPNPPVSFSYSGHLTVISATGGLAGLRLYGTLSGTQSSYAYYDNYSFAS
jgi:hypothetical protein